MNSMFLDAVNDRDGVGAVLSGDMSLRRPSPLNHPAEPKSLFVQSSSSMAEERTGLSGSVYRFTQRGDALVGVVLFSGNPKPLSELSNSISVDFIQAGNDIANRHFKQTFLSRPTLDGGREWYPINN